MILKAEMAAVITNNTCAPTSHNILLYEDGHAVVADFGGKRLSAVFHLLYKKNKAATTIFFIMVLNYRGETVYLVKKDRNGFIRSKTYLCSLF